MKYRNGISELRVSGFLQDPKSLTLDELEPVDIRAQRYIDDCEEMIDQLKSYRLELAARSKELLTMGYHTKVSLIREKRWKGNVYYYLTKEIVYDDGTTKTISSEKYAGTERHKAINDFNACKKQFPQYEYYEDIAKGRWERKSGRVARFFHMRFNLRAFQSLCKLRNRSDYLTKKIKKTRV